MNQLTKIILPKLGESILSATIVQWYKKPGDTIIKDEPLLEVNTDKVASEIPSPVSGLLVEIHAREGEELQVGELLASISTSSDNNLLHLEKDVIPLASSNEENHSFLTPAVLRLLQERKIPLSNIDKIPHTGQGGRLTKQDVERYTPTCEANVTAQACAPFACAASVGEVERIKMSPLRKAIAENMVKSFYEAPHASLVTEVDVTELVEHIASKKASFLTEHGVKLTITSFMALAIVQAALKYPLLNASIEGDTILQKKSINLGLAVGVEHGVMVPVLRKCQLMNLAQVAKAISDLSDRARQQKLTLTDVQDGSITLTNFGMTGISIGIPIIRHPEVAIIGMGAMTRKVLPLLDDSLAIRTIMMVSLTFDHRVADGLYSCAFLAELKKQLEQPLTT